MAVISNILLIYFSFGGKKVVGLLGFLFYFGVGFFDCFVVIVGLLFWVWLGGFLGVFFPFSPHNFS